MRSVSQSCFPVPRSSRFRHSYRGSFVLDLHVTLHGEHYTYGRKLALLLALQRQADFLYSDADVVLFRQPDLILETLRGPSAVGLFMQEPNCRSVDPWVTETAVRLGLPWHNDLNSGLLWVPRDSLDLVLVERLLADWRPAFFHRVAEQTILGVLMASNGALGLPPADYVVSNQGMFFWQRDGIDYERIVVRHFVGNVRHLLYRTALPRLLAMNRRESSRRDDASTLC